MSIAYPPDNSDKRGFTLVVKGKPRPLTTRKYNEQDRKRHPYFVIDELQHILQDAGKAGAELDIQVRVKARRTKCAD